MLWGGLVYLFSVLFQRGAEDDPDWAFSVLGPVFGVFLVVGGRRYR